MNIQQFPCRIKDGNTLWVTPNEMRWILTNSDRCQAWWLSGEVTQRNERNWFHWITTMRTGKWWIRKLWASQEMVAETIECLKSHGFPSGVSTWGACWRRVGMMIPPPSDRDIREKLNAGDWPYPHAETKPGIYPGVWNEWDIKAAYPWASSEGLPAPWTLQICDEYIPSDTAVHLLRNWKESSEHSLIPSWAKPREPSKWFWDSKRGHMELRDAHRVMFSEDHPSTLHWIPGESANKLGLSWEPKDHVVSIAWSKTLDITPAFDRVREVFPPHIAKMVLASHWGIWSKGSGARMGMFSYGRPLAKNDGTDAECIYALPSSSNPLFAGLLQARISERVSKYAGDSPRTYVDSVLLPDGYIPTPHGHYMGDWRIKNRFEVGIEQPEHPRRPKALCTISG